MAFRHASDQVSSSSDQSIGAQGVHNLQSGIPALPAELTRDDPRRQDGVAHEDRRVYRLYKCGDLFGGEQESRSELAGEEPRRPPKSITVA